jgi:hypothetical protein
MCGKKKNFSGTESPVEENQGREVASFRDTRRFIHS